MILRTFLFSALLHSLLLSACAVTAPLTCQEAEQRRRFGSLFTEPSGLRAMRQQERDYACGVDVTLPRGSQQKKPAP